MTIDELSQSRDSIVNLLDQTRKELGIKNNELNLALSFKTVIKETRVDTVTFMVRDSISTCDFDQLIVFNDYTRLNISLRNNIVKADLDLSDRYQLFDYSTRE